MNELADLLRYHYVVHASAGGTKSIPWSWSSIKARQERAFWEGKEKLSQGELIKGMNFD